MSPDKNPPNDSPSDADARPRADEAVYLYALTPKAASIDHPGMDDRAPVETVACGTWAAVVDSVPVGPWTGSEGEENMASLAWVAPRACRHEEVVEAVMDAGPVYPARFGTLFSSLGRLREAVAAHEEVLASYFDRVAGTEEWSVKGHLDRGAAEAHLAAAGGDAPDGEAEDAPGTAYLKRRRREQEARAGIDDWVDRQADALFDALQAGVDGIRVLEPRRRPGEAREAVLHWAVLVPRGSDRGMPQYVSTLAERHAGPGLDLEASGPWPPYNFRPALQAEDGSDGLSPGGAMPGRRPD
jgi:hypothetical protein